MSQPDVVIVGGGIWGLSTAFHLARRADRRVLLLERNESLADETTKQSAGQVGQLRADPLLINAVGYTLDLLGGFQNETELDAGFVRSGSLHLSLNAQRSTMFDRLANVAREYDVDVESIDKQAMRDLAPKFSFEPVDSALFVPNDGYVAASQFSLAMATFIESHGVEIQTGVEVHNIESINGGNKILTTNRGSITTDSLVLTCGPWSDQIVKQLGFDLPVFPIRLQQARTMPCGIPANHPVVRVPDKSCYLRPEGDGLLFGFFDPDPKSIDLRDDATKRTADVLPEPAIVDDSIRRLQNVMPDLARLAISQYRQGMITCSPDGRFVIGPVPTLSKTWVATGCGGTGIAASGAVGKWLSQSVVDGSPDTDLSTYSPSRFKDRTNDRDWLREACRETSAAYYRLSSKT